MKPQSSRPLWMAIAMLACMSISARATAGQGIAPRFEVFAEGGGSLYTSHASATDTAVGNPPQAVYALFSIDSLSTTARLFAGFRYHFDRNEAFEASYSYSPGNATQTQTCVSSNGTACSGLNLSGKTHAHFVSFNYVRYFRVAGHLRPFLTGGLGFVYVHEPRFSPLFAQPFSPTHFAANFGGGIDWDVSTHWGVRAEYRDFLFDDSQFYSGNPVGLTHNQVPSLGVVYRF